MRLHCVSMRGPLVGVGLVAWFGLGVVGARAQEPRRVAPEPRRPAIARVAAPAYVNHSELQYRVTNPDEASEVYEEPSPPEAGPVLAGPAAAVMARPGQQAAVVARPAGGVLRGGVRRTGDPDRPIIVGRVPAWGTRESHEAQGSRVVADGPLGRLGPALAAPATPRSAVAACIQPTVTREGSTCCNYNQPDQLAGTDVMYRQPRSVFGTESAAREFAGTVRAGLPMFLPFRDPDVVASHGWIYNGSDRNFHGAVDYSKKKDATGPNIDPAFQVRSIADGVVVAVFWDDWSGNIVTIEHTAPNGDLYRSNYKHLRNGLGNDLAQARGLPKVKPEDRFDDEGNATSRYKYELFANLPNPSTRHWGTNGHTIQVEVGDHVRAGQLIGWSGNTGPGGAGKGLNDDGTPKNSDTANNHLHLMVAVPDPNNAGDWVQADPYGVYGQIKESECYDLLDTPAYVRLFAPFYPSFHNVPATYLSFYWDYYTGMGMGLQTVSLHRKGNQVLASGAFQRGLPPAWYMRMYMTGADYQSWFDTYGAQGFRPREISVTHDGAGQPRFSVIWKKIQGEGVVAYHGMTDGDWAARWQEHVVNGGMRVDERAAYRQGNGRRLAAVFVKGGGGPSGFAELHYMTGADYQQKVNEFAGQGMLPVRAEAEELPEGLRFGAIWQKLPGQWAARHGLTPAQYQSTFEDMAEEGFRLWDVQGYDDSGRFIAIWTKP